MASAGRPVVRELHSPVELEAGHAVLRELRSDLEYPRFVALYEAARHADHYRMFGVFLPGLPDAQCVAVMGCRVLHDFVHGKHLYVDDLVVTEGRRSSGLGEELLRFAESLAHELGCRGLRLSTGIRNEGARRFYERCGWEPKSVVFKKTLA